MPRRCTQCSSDTLTQIDGIDGWSLFTIGSPLLQFQCKTCGHVEADQFDKGAILAGFLVGGGLLAFNLLDDGAMSFIRYVVSFGPDLLEDLQRDGIGGLLGFLAFFLFLSTVFLLLPVIMLSYSVAAILWRRRHPEVSIDRMETSTDLQQSDEPPVPEQVSPERPSWIRSIIRTALIALTIQPFFWGAAKLALLHDAQLIAGVAFIVTLFSLRLRTSHIWESPFWLIGLFFFLFFIPCSLLLEAILG